VVADRDWHGLAGKVRPMLAGAGELPGDEDGWAYEMKWDGLRAIAGIGGGVVSLFSRTGKDIASKYPELQGLAAVAGESGFVLDGEIVAFGGDSWPSFEALQQRMNIPSLADARRLAAQIPVTYLVFDLLYTSAGSQLDQPYQARRAQLDQLAINGPNWQTPPAFIDVPADQVQALSLRHGLEGVMAKRLRSRYEPGRRSPSWRKIKNVHRQEVVVGGWKPGEGARTGLFGSLLVGVQSPAGLAYAGHVGTGFTQQTLQMLSKRLNPLRTESSPFATEVPAEHARVAVWVRPTVVIEVTFVEWTSTGRLRAASYQGLRTDKDPAEVIREPG
jgi:bifunctional non-homologous end joining protein LigD